MSIELRQAAEQVLEAFETFGEADDFASLFALTQKMNALRDALAQHDTPEPVPMTDEQVDHIWNSLPIADGFWLAFARAIEAHHDIKPKEQA